MGGGYSFGILPKIKKVDLDWCGYVTGSWNCFYRAGVSANISETFFNIETSRAHKKKKLFLFFSGGGGYWIWHAVFSCWQKMRGGGIINIRLVYDLKSKLQIKIQGWYTFWDFSYYNITPPVLHCFQMSIIFFLFNIGWYYKSMWATKTILTK